MYQESFLGNESMQTPNRPLYYNEIMARTNVNYPVCKKLDILDRELRVEEENRAAEERRYDELLLKGQLNCGNIRVGMGIFSKR